MGRKVLQLANYAIFVPCVCSLGHNFVKMPYSHTCSWLQGFLSRVLRWGATVLVLLQAVKIHLNMQDL